MTAVSKAMKFGECYHTDKNSAWFSVTSTFHSFLRSCQFFSKTKISEETSVT